MNCTCWIGKRTPLGEASKHCSRLTVGINGHATRMAKEGYFRVSRPRKSPERHSAVQNLTRGVDREDRGVGGWEAAVLCTQESHELALGEALRAQINVYGQVQGVERTPLPPPLIAPPPPTSSGPAPGDHAGPRLTCESCPPLPQPDPAQARTNQVRAVG